VAVVSAAGSSAGRQSPTDAGRYARSVPGQALPPVV